MANKFVIYTTRYCPYCIAAKKLLQSKNISFHEIDVTEDDKAREALITLSGGRETVPQVFINDHAVGGYDDLLQFFKSDQPLV